MLPPVVTRHLDEVARLQPELAAAADLQRAVLDCQYRREAPAPSRLPAPEEVAARLARGIPLLPGYEADIDLGHAVATLDCLLAVAEGRRETQAAADRVRQAARDDSTARGWLLAALVGDDEALAGVIARLDAPLLASLLRWSVAPTLGAWATEAMRRYDLDRWEQGYCPVCAAWPLLGELRGVELGRRLRCGLCGADWRGQRLRCPYCETADPSRLGHFSVEGDARWQVATCAECGSYLKTLTTFDALPAAQLAVEDLASLVLDVLAGERGLTRPAGRCEVWQYEPTAGPTREAGRP